MNSKSGLVVKKRKSSNKAVGIFLINSPDNSNVYGARCGDFEWTGSACGVDSCNNRVHIEALPIHLSTHCCCRMCCLASIHSVTDRQTDRQTDETVMPIAQYRLLRAVYYTIGITCVFVVAVTLSRSFATSSKHSACLPVSFNQTSP